MFSDFKVFQTALFDDEDGLSVEHTGLPIHKMVGMGVIIDVVDKSNFG